MKRHFEHNSFPPVGTVFLGFFLRKFTVFLYLASILAAVLYPQGVQAQSNIKSNLEVFEQEISGELEKFFFLPGVNRDVKFVFWVSSPKKSKEDKKFIESVVKKTAERNKLKYSIAKDEVMDSPDTVYNKCAVTVNKLYTDYTKLIKNGFLGEKSMQREITSSLGINISLNNGEVQVEDEIKTKYDDEIPYDDYTQFESSEYKFTQSTQPDISLLESIIFPAAVVTLSAVAAILFFSIRSK
ncbi:MAG TPA: hypothetical protein VG961_04440 [Ignavibacteria bacterium]|nr:hypothetical protein [Ignavibacteria bacterium]